MENLQSNDADLSDETQDFRFLSLFSKSDQASLPRRGEKDFEPDGTNLQDANLGESRRAMYDALSYERKHSSKLHVSATWRPSQSLAEVKAVKGPLFQTMGRADSKGIVWLLPEETIYLVERGNMQCWWESGIPMTLQAVYTACMESAGGLDSYQVYAYLKRCGFVIYRSLDSSEHEPSPKQQNLGMSCTNLVRPALQQVYNISSIFFALFSFENRPSYGPLLFPGSYKSYQDIYKRITIKEDKKNLLSLSGDLLPTIPILDIYKPKPGFKKSSPGIPDFRIIVIPARDTTVPSLTDLERIFSRSRSASTESSDKKTPLQKLKQGKGSIILAIVDSGVISFVRFTDLSFTENPLSAIKPSQGTKNLGKGSGKGSRK